MIAGLQKMTLLDYPGKVACTVFLQGCNFRCPFCHNSPLLPGKGESGITEEELLAFLQKRKGLLDAVCVSGGEPTLYAGLEDLLRRIKELGYLVKLDTNGSRPAVLKRLTEEKLVDYVAMDVKNSPARYGQTVGAEKLDIAPLEESLRFLLAGTVSYELRTTVVEEFHDPEAMQLDSRHSPSQILSAAVSGSGQCACARITHAYGRKTGSHAADIEPLYRGSGGSWHRLTTIYCD